MKPKPLFNWRHQYDQEADEREGALAATINNEPSLTQQHHTEDADLNIIAKRYGLTDGAIDPLAMHPNYFGDFTTAMDLRDILEISRDAKEKFASLPASVRTRFHNDPATLLEFINDDENVDEAKKLGLLHDDYQTPAQIKAAADAKELADFKAAKQKAPPIAEPQATK